MVELAPIDEFKEALKNEKVDAKLKHSAQILLDQGPDLGKAVLICQGNLIDNTAPRYTYEFGSRIGNIASFAPVLSAFAGLVRIANISHFTASGPGGPMHN